VRHRSIVSDRKLARIVKRCRDLPGSELFQYIDNDGRRHSIDSGDVNDYLQTVSGREITAKDFRTWARTNLAVIALHELNEIKPTKAGSLQVVTQVAKQLGNTPAVCRKCYIHPAVLESYLAGSLQLKWTNASDEQAFGMWAIERDLIRFLKDRRRENRSGPMLKATLKASPRAAKSRRARAARG
jgi:DNA topoisomerase I